MLFYKNDIDYQNLILIRYNKIYVLFLYIINYRLRKYIRLE